MLKVCRVRLVRCLFRHASKQITALRSRSHVYFSLYVVGEFDLATGCVVNRDPRVLIHGRDILTVSLPDTSYGGTKAG